MIWFPTAYFLLAALILCLGDTVLKQAGTSQTQEVSKLLVSSCYRPPLDHGQPTPSLLSHLGSDNTFPVSPCITP